MISITLQEKHISRKYTREVFSPTCKREIFVPIFTFLQVTQNNEQPDWDYWNSSPCSKPKCVFCVILWYPCSSLDLADLWVLLQWPSVQALRGQLCCKVFVTQRSWNASLSSNASALSKRWHSFLSNAHHFTVFQHKLFIALKLGFFCISQAPLLSESEVCEF